MDGRKGTALEVVLEQLIEHGPGKIPSVFARAFELAMQIEPERFLGAGHYDRTPERYGYANDYKLKQIDTPAGTVNVQMPGWIDSEWLKQLTAEQLATVKGWRGFTKLEWQKLRERN